MTDEDLGKLIVEAWEDGHGMTDSFIAAARKARELLQSPERDANSYGASDTDLRRDALAMAVQVVSANPNRPMDVSVLEAAKQFHAFLTAKDVPA